MFDRLRRDHETFPKLPTVRARQILFCDDGDSKVLSAVFDHWELWAADWVTGWLSCELSLVLNGHRKTTAAGKQNIVLRSWQLKWMK